MRAASRRKPFKPPPPTFFFNLMAPSGMKEPPMGGQVEQTQSPHLTSGINNTQATHLWTFWAARVLQRNKREPAFSWAQKPQPSLTCQGASSLSPAYGNSQLPPRVPAFCSHTSHGAPHILPTEALRTTFCIVLHIIPLSQRPFETASLLSPLYR